MIVKQVSVFVENTVGRLADLTKILTDNNIDLKASTIAETVDFGILRCIVEEPEKTVKISWFTVLPTTVPISICRKRTAQIPSAFLRDLHRNMASASGIRSP